MQWAHKPGVPNLVTMSLSDASTGVWTPSVPENITVKGSLLH
jgi:hypothetical protein